jgi:hypothetical protein
MRTYFKKEKLIFVKNTTAVSPAKSANVIIAA